MVTVYHGYKPKITIYVTLRFLFDTGYHSQTSVSSTASSVGSSASGVSRSVGNGGAYDFDPTNPNVPRNCTITRPPPITKPGRYVKKHFFHAL